jgi:glycosyltransferase involved in cell wall biosynthesis
MPMTTPLVSVVIPAFNAARTIRRAIDSALAQTYNNLEIVVVDDGSRDATSEVVATYSCPTIRLLRLPRNVGASGATNQGLAAARGQFVAFLDADDEWQPTKLAKQVAALMDNPSAVMATCCCRFVNAEGQVCREFGLLPQGVDKKAVWRSLLAVSLIAKPCVLARLDAVQKAGLFDVDLPVAEDQHMWIKLALAGEVEFVPEFLTIVHDAPDSLTKVYADKVDRYVLPMIKRHLAEQRHRLSRDEVREILASRYTSVGRNLYLANSVLRGGGLILRAIMLGHHVPENLWYLAAASPPAKAFKRLIGHPGGKVGRDRGKTAQAKEPDRLLAPQRSARVDVGPGPPILMVIIDAEAEFDWEGPFSSSLVSVRNLSRQAIAQDVFDRYEVTPTYLVDYAVATQAEGYEPIRTIYQSGRCDIGAHLQPWENPPFAEVIGARTSFNHNLPAWLQKAKLERLTEAIIGTFGIRPLAYRAGRYGVSDGIAQTLFSLGYKIDLSVLPRHDLRRRHGPDFRDVLDQPYWFGPDRTLLEIPSTTGFSGLLARCGTPERFSATLYTALSRPFGTKWHLPGAFARSGLLERITLTPEGMSLDELKRLTKLLLHKGQRVFTFSYHSSALLPGCTPYVRSTQDLARMIKTIEQYIRYFIGELGGISMTPTEFHATLARQPPTLTKHPEIKPAEVPAQ